VCLSWRRWFFDLSDRYARLDAKKDPLIGINVVVPWGAFRPLRELVWRKPDECGADVRDAGSERALQPVRRSDRVSGVRPAFVHAVPRAWALGTGCLTRRRSGSSGTIWRRRAWSMNFSRSSTGIRRGRAVSRVAGRSFTRPSCRASIVPVLHNYNKREKNASIKADETPEGRADKRSQKDVGAHWTRKHGKSRYGYKDHLDADRKHKLIRRYHVSPSRDIAWQCPAGQWMPPHRCCRA
jgi:IS5 family transposase